MTVVELATYVQAPRELCFDLSRSIEIHLGLAERTRERVVAGRKSGLMELGDSVTWEARHLWLTLELSVTISAYDRPRFFRDEGSGRGIRSLVHDHRFEVGEGGTRMLDTFAFQSVVPMLDPVILKPYFTSFLRERADGIRRLAENGEWRRFVEARA